MRISTDKGWLEPLTCDHARQWFELIHVSHNQLHAWLPWSQSVHSAEDTARFIQQLVAERGPQYVVKAEGNICGGIGFQLRHRGQVIASVGYWLGSDFVGQGIMQDAVRHLCRYGFTQLGLSKIEIRCAEQNSKSRRLAERLGFYLEATKAHAECIGGRYVDHVIYSMLPAEFALSYPKELFQVAPRRGCAGF